eukprot:CAMPEP_0181328040 /NCGR_PEP_ID=MMETSP1101-20121128/22466_1 /TAXON_ID=46948 /ORGANISM="Rhodomonas abbreviata, Strain Caron Lab Isolate" /LENGTH=60 /DNA_ID=CAMNT_0023436827 /DNA_START=331 /DNA_END=509 /DNA_ORIENTATION=+
MLAKKKKKMTDAQLKALEALEQFEAAQEPSAVATEEAPVEKTPPPPAPGGGKKKKGKGKG